jgi:hypothetical protein
MRTARVVCDRCGAEATPATEGGWIQITTPLRVIRPSITDAPREQSATDLCARCGVELGRFLRNEAGA